MSGQYIIVQSITYAYKGMELLERKNIRCSVERAPASISSCGCNYSIKLYDPRYFERAVSYLKNSNIEVLSSGVA